MIDIAFEVSVSATTQFSPTLWLPAKYISPDTDLTVIFVMRWTSSGWSSALVSCEHGGGPGRASCGGLRNDDGHSGR
jgi:hypothetical protein